MASLAELDKSVKTADENAKAAVNSSNSNIKNLLASLSGLDNTAKTVSDNANAAINGSNSNIKGM
ncbi:MAG: hypothetical protein ACT4OJ_14505 [Bacteroidota bacterium]